MKTYPWRCNRCLTVMTIAYDETGAVIIVCRSCKQHVLFNDFPLPPFVDKKQQ